MKEKPYKLATRVLIKDRLGRCLLLKRSLTSKTNGGKWEFPGGKVDSGEDFYEALKREITEETGLKVSFQRVAGAVEMEMPDFKVAQIILEANTQASEVRLSNEHSEYAWIKPQDLLNMDLTPCLVSFARNYSKAII